MTQRQPFNDPYSFFFFFWSAPFPSSLWSVRRRGGTSTGHPSRWKRKRRKARIMDCAEQQTGLRWRISEINKEKYFWSENLCIMLSMLSQHTLYVEFVISYPDRPPRAVVFFFFFAISAHVCLKQANKIAFILRDVWKSSFPFCGRTNHSQARAYISFLCLVKSGGTRPATLMQIWVIYRQWHHRRVGWWWFMKQPVGWMLTLHSNL